jgi:ribosome-associated toxin RatA of RatAB toxin-antitoxin module
MNRRLFMTVSRSMTVMMIVIPLFFHPSDSRASITALPDTLSAEKARLLNGEVIVVLSSLDNGVTGVSGKIHIAAPPDKVWTVLTDYDNHKNFIPRLTDSGLISDNGAEQVMFQRGKTRIFLFQKSVYIQLRIRGEYLRRLEFQEISGDFKVYKGRWLLEDYPKGQGTFLSYESEVKPAFFAPSFVVKFVQKHDFPEVLSAIKVRAESSAISATRSGKPR